MCTLSFQEQHSHSIMSACGNDASGGQLGARQFNWSHGMHSGMSLIRTFGLFQFIIDVSAILSTTSFLLF